MDSTEIAPNKPRRGIYLLPNLFTTGGMFAGFYAIIAAINAHYVDAAIAVFVAGLLDGLDGRIARLTNTQSDFGMQYDSLADLVSFGVAPALVMYTWALDDLRGYGPLMGKAGWAAAFLYAACAAVRLARFNTQAGTVDKRFFIGLASPAAAGVMMSFVWAAESLGWPAMSHPLAALGVCVLTAVLMVTRIRYWSFKSWPARERVPFLVLPLILGVFALLAVSPSLMLLSITTLYLLSGPTLAVASLLRRRDDAPRPG